MEKSCASVAPAGQTTNHDSQPGGNRAHAHPIRQSSIPIANALLSTVNATRQRQPMCVECEKSLPNQIVFDKIESIIRLMQDESNGLPVKTAKSFMSKIPSVFTGTDLIQWMMRNLRLDDQQEAIHLANLIASHGYIFPIEDHTLSIKNDCTFYRFQTPCLWPSNNIDPENTDYAVYLCKRTMQGKARLELADYEAENLARLQKMFSRKWEFIFMQAESQAKVDKKRDKLERKVLDSQERAFWDVYRPVPGCVNTTELDIKKACRLSKSAKRCSQCQKITKSPAATSSATATTTTTTTISQTQSVPAKSSKQIPTETEKQQPVAAPKPATKQQQQQPAKSQELQTESINNNSNHANQATQMSANKTDTCSSSSPSFSSARQAQPQQSHSQNLQPSETNLSESRKLETEVAVGGGAKTAKSGEDPRGQPSDRNEADEQRDKLQQQHQEPAASTSRQTVDRSPTVGQQQAIPKESKTSTHLAHHHHHHAHGHAHHGHHHHHHHHHPHPHSHHHAHHHHHHHHHKTCPHHQKQQQQQQAKLSASSNELKSQGCHSELRASSKSSMRQTKKHSSSSIDQSHENTERPSRRRSECQQHNSMSECPSVASALSTAGDVHDKNDQVAPADQKEATTGGEQSSARSKRRLNTSEQQQSKNDPVCDQRPASACCSSTSLKDQHKSQSARVGRQTSAELMAAELRDKMTASSGTTGGGGGGGAPMVRKSSLNILRTPHAGEQQPSSASGLAANRKGSVHLASSSSSSMFSQHQQHHNQRAQLKGTQSVCDNSLAAAAAAASSASSTADALDNRNSSQDLTQAATYNSISLVDKQNINNLERELESLKVRLDRGGVKMSKVTQSYLSYFKQWAEYDPFIAQPIPSNPWQSDSTELWDSERQTKDVHCRRVRRWAFSLKELLSDPAGREQFHRFLEKEFSAENLKFWDAVQELKRVPSKDVARRVEAIWTEYLAQDANCPINIDSKSYETSKKNMAKNKNNRYIFDEAAGHVYQLMKNDSYPRYLRSDMYKDYKEASERRRPNQVAFDVFKPQITTLKHKFNF